jgi:hypothetical protein
MNSIPFLKHRILKKEKQMLDDPFSCLSNRRFQAKLGKAPANNFYILMFKTNLVSVDKKFKVLLGQKIE